MINLQRKRIEIALAGTSDIERQIQDMFAALNKIQDRVENLTRDLHSIRLEIIREAEIQEVKNNDIRKQTISKPINESINYSANESWHYKNQSKPKTEL